MDYLLARITTQNHDNTRLLLSDTTTFENVENITCLPYNDERKLQSGEWFCVENFSRQSYYNQRLFSQIETAMRTPIGLDEYDKIKFLIAVQNDENNYYFQRVLAKSKVVQKKGLGVFNGHFKMIDVENMVIINSEPDAIYLKNENRLLFKDISRIRPIFNGIEVLFREATNEEVASFLNIDDIVLENGFDSSKVSVPNRRRISNAIAQYNSFLEDQKEILKDYIKDYCPDIIDQDTSEVHIGSDVHLKNFIYAIDQRFYETPINQQKRVATSVENL